MTATQNICTIVKPFFEMFDANEMFVVSMIIASNSLLNHAHMKKINACASIFSDGTHS